MGAKLAVLLLGLVSGVQMMFSDEQMAVWSALRANYHRYIQAYKAKDIKAAMALTAPDFTLERGKQTLSRGQVQSELVRELASERPVEKMTFDLNHIRVHGFSVTVTAVRHTVTSRSGTRGQKLAQEEIRTTLDTWLKVASGWKLEKSKLLDVTTTVSGKPVAIGGSPAK